MTDAEEEPHDTDGTALQASDPRANVRNVRIVVDAMWPAGYGMSAHQTYDVDRWAVRNGVLILIRSQPGAAPDRTHIPLASIARFTVTRP